ncbi:hypothetical protein NC653_006073 [Populus alba x Populus x berolinensis]|uniref:Uncharacterized protein n=1 Tax=Populus alba x Populus x berolinensis TaxID=444605 RepID=A0AAD6RDE5_9ROSI|nr:hypothetical protein NC653_006073 [Populus alba x Populus x berolinensis]
MLSLKFHWETILRRSTFGVLMSSYMLPWS